MKAELKNYYEILGISPEAKDEEIEAAYKKALSTYSQDSAALYSLYTEKEKELKILNLKEAYGILKDPESRRMYNVKLESQKNESLNPVDINRAANGSEFVDVDEIGIEENLFLRKPLAVMDEGDAAAAEHYRILYTKLEQVHMNGDNSVFAITSAIKGEGKTTTALNLAYIMSEEFKKKVILIESDLRKSAISESHLEPYEGSGLVNILSGTADVDQAIYNLNNSNLYILPAKIGVRNSTELLASPKMPQIIKVLKSEFDYIILDCPPVLPLADMNILSKMVDKVLLVVRAGKTHKDVVGQAIKALSRDKIAGFILNGTEKASKNYYYY